MSGDSASVTLHPQILWAQRPTCVYLTVGLSDVKDEVVEIKSDRFHFKGRVNNPSAASYEIDFEFYAEVDPNKAVRQSGDRVITYCIDKKEAGVWPRFLKDTAKQPWLKTDFNRWKDLDDSDSDGEGFGGLGGGGGNFQDMLSMMGNKGFDDDLDDGNEPDIDSDDDELPDLDEPVKEKVDELPKEKAAEEPIRKEVEHSNEEKMEAHSNENKAEESSNEKNAEKNVEELKS